MSEKEVYHEVDLEATADADGNAKKSLRLEQFSQHQVLEAIKELKQYIYKNKHCIRCSYVGIDSIALSVHISRMHMDMKLRWCCACNGEFDNLTDHVAANHYMCKFCSRKFQGVGQLTQHLRNHSDVKPFACKFCQKCFIRRSQLSVHLRKHMRRKLYKCNRCSYACPESSTLTQHMKKHVVYKPYSDGPHVCLMCKRTFTTNANLNVHINTHDVSFLEI